MKKIVILCGLVFALNGMASMDSSEAKGTKPTSTQISKNRACFAELADNGCGDAAEDAKHFRTCLADVYPRLSTECKKLMSDLYGSR